MSGVCRHLTRRPLMTSIARWLGALYAALFRDDAPIGIGGGR